MNHGSARTLVVIFRAVEIDDSQGGSVEQWNEVGRFYGYVRPVSTTENLAAGGLQAATQWQLTAAYRLDVAERDQLLIQPDETRVLEVTGVRDPDLRRKTIEVDAVERRIDDTEEWLQSRKLKFRSRV